MPVTALYAQPLSRIHCLTVDDIIESDQELFIRLGDPPTPVPQPFADRFTTSSCPEVRSAPPTG